MKERGVGGDGVWKGDNAGGKIGGGQGGVKGGKVALVQQSMSSTAQHSTAQQ